MVTLGIDSGSKTTKGIVFDGKEIKKTMMIPTSANPKKSMYELYGQLYRPEVKYTVVTGYGRELLIEADHQVSEITCHAEGCVFLNPNIHAIIDIGGQDSKVIQLNKVKRASDFLMNDKCAAGTGRFIENMMRILEIDLNQIDEMVKSQHPANISNMCTVFAESEVISLLAKEVPSADIALGVIHSVAKRTAHFAQRLPLGDSIFFSGGVANSKIMADVLESYLEKPLKTHALGQYAGAIGAALIGWKRKKMI